MKNKSLLSAFFIAVLLSGLVLVGAANFSSVQASEVMGILSSNTTWTAESGPYNLMGPVTVSSGVTLTIEAGVTVNLNGYKIQVNGILYARGSNADNIVFVSDPPGNEGITFTSSSTSWNEGAGTGCIIENSVLDSVSISVTYSAPKIINNTIAASANAIDKSAILIDSGSPEISNNVIRGDIENLNSAAPIVNNNLITGGIYGMGILTSSPIITRNNITQGIWKEYRRGTGIRCDGSNVYVADNIIFNCVTGINAYDGTSTIERNLVFNSELGIKIGGMGTISPTIRNNTIVNNEVGIYVSTGPLGSGSIGSLTIRNNNIQDNFNNSICIANEATGNIDATYNWWNTTDQEAINQSIYDFKNDPNLGKVTFVPFLNEPNPTAPEIPYSMLKPKPTPAPTPTPTPTATPTPAASPTPTPTPSGSSVSGLISSDTTWTLTGSPYIVTGDVLVDADVVLNIEAGVVVKFAGGTNLIVDGILVAGGDEAQPITFTSNAATPSPGDWGTITFRGSSAESALRWASIKYASDGVTVTAGSPTLEHCSVSNNQRYGVYVSAGAPTIVKTTIYENGKDGIWNYVGTVTVTNCTISSNKGNGIYKDSESITVRDSLIAYNLQSGIYGGAGGQFTVSNCTVSYNGYDGVTICYSNMVITDSEITYNNRDGVRMESGTSSGRAEVTGNEISHNSGNGVYKSSGSMQLTYNNITFNNVGIAATPFKLVFIDSFQEQSGDTIIDQNNIVDNSVYAVENIGPGTNIFGAVLNLTATNNWWGTTDASVIDQLIRDVRDDFNLGRVEYVPFLTEPATTPADTPNATDYTPSPTPAPSPTPTPTPSSATPSTIPVPGQSYFYIESNSTVTALFFNSTSAELSFAVSGESGTWGYVKITIAKTLVPNIQNVKAYLDGNQLNVAITDNGDAWLLHFTYTHSTHHVLVNLGSFSSDDSQIGQVIVVGLPIVAVVLFFAVTKLRERKPKTGKE